MSDEYYREQAEERGAMRAEIRHLAVAVTSLQADVKDLTAALNQARGGWKALAALSGLGGAMTGAIVSVIAKKIGG